MGLSPGAREDDGLLAAGFHLVKAGGTDGPAKSLASRGKVHENGTSASDASVLVYGAMSTLAAGSLHGWFRNRNFERLALRFKLFTLQVNISAFLLFPT